MKAKKLSPFQKADQILTEIFTEETEYHNDSIDLGGTIRRKTPQETLTFLKPLLKKFGITRVADIGGLDTIGIPVAVCVRPNSKHLSGSQGKGRTRELAQISAIMESIESYHTENAPPADIQGTYQNLSKNYPLLNPNLFQSGHFQHRDLLNLDMGWIECLDLINEKSIYIPHTIVNINSSQLNPEWGFYQLTSNGLASGNTLSEAICHGLYEVIERDSVWRWMQLSPEESEKTLIDMTTIDSEENRYLIERFRQAGCKIKVWDAASSVGIPTYYCILYDEKRLSAGGEYFGCGSHLSQDIALSRALTEVAQARATLISGSRDDVYPEVYEQQRIQQKNIMTPELSQMEKPIQGGKNYKACLRPNVSQSLLGNIKTTLECLKANGYQNAIVFNHTKMEFNVPVVQVFVPGMIFSGFRV